MNILIAGLGNKGDTYQGNRHNVGFMFVDWFLTKLTTNSQLPTTSFAYDKYSDAEIAKVELRTTDYQLQTIIAKPQTLMNRSGYSVNKLATSYKLPTTNVFVAHDDLDLQLGEFKISFGKGPKIHNGVNSIETHLKTKQFWRIRIGIDNRKGIPISGKQYVLSDFRKEEKEKIHKTFQAIDIELENKIKEISSS